MDSLEKNRDAQFVNNLFGSISTTYDFANDVITFGMARLWRKELVRMSNAQPGDRVLDCATGTGDLALEFKKAVGSDGHVTGSDFCAEMIALAPGKAHAKNLDVHFEWGDATALKYEQRQFDVVSIAYGIRNIPNRSAAIKEMGRVLKSGGRLMILETGEIRNPVFRSAIQFYNRNVMPTLGGWVSGKKEAYQYLRDSSGEFPSGHDFVNEIMASGIFKECTFKSVMGGASFIYRAVKD